MTREITLTIDGKPFVFKGLVGVTLEEGDPDATAALGRAGLHVRQAVDLAPVTDASGMYKNLVAGEWVSPPATVIRYENRAPADRSRVLGFVPETAPAEVDRACALADGAFDAWRASSGDLRTKAMLRVGELLSERNAELCAIVTREMGKSLRDAKLDVDEAIGVVEAVAPQGMSMTGDTYPNIVPGLAMECRVAPRGVAGIITPFNFPVAIPIAQIVAALVSGNPVVWKPSHLVPESSHALAKIVMAALRETAARLGATVPPGVFSMVQGDAVPGEAVVRHPAVRTISFTGSKAVGDAVGSLGESLGKRVMKECGGINLFYVHRSANLPRAARSLVYGKTITSGQRCTSIQEVLCDAEVYDAFKAEVLKLVPEVVAGPGDSAEIARAAFALPPLVSAEQQARFGGLIAKAVEQGAHLWWQQALPAGLAQRGYYAPLTFVEDVGPDNVLYSTEIFGPAGVLTRVSGLREAIGIINAKIGIVGCIDATDKDVTETFLDRVLRTRIDDGRHGTGCFWATKFGGDRGAGSGNPALDEDMVFGYCIRKTVYRAYTPQDPAA